MYFVYNYKNNKNFKTMQQFRLVILDDYDNVISVEYESPVFEGENEFDKDINKALFEHLLSIEYNLLDYENIPILEYQRRVCDKKGNWGEWRYLSDPVEDYYSL